MKEKRKRKRRDQKVNLLTVGEQFVPGVEDARAEMGGQGALAVPARTAEDRRPDLGVKGLLDEGALEWL